MACVKDNALVDPDRMHGHGPSYILCHAELLLNSVVRNPDFIGLSV
jgi:hypothetical protein